MGFRSSSVNLPVDQPSFHLDKTSRAPRVPESPDGDDREARRGEGQYAQEDEFKDEADSEWGSESVLDEPCGDGDAASSKLRSVRAREITHGERTRRARLRKKSRKSVSSFGIRFWVLAVRGGCEGISEGLMARARR